MKTGDEPLGNRTNKGRRGEANRAFSGPSTFGAKGLDRPPRGEPRRMTGRRRQAKKRRFFSRGLLCACRFA